MMLAPAAVAEITFVYDVTSDGGYYHSPTPSLTGSITFEGNVGDGVPQLGAIAFQFTVDGGPTWNDTDSTFPIDSITFNGTLGSATLTATSGGWQIEDPSESNADLYLLGTPDGSRYGETWGWCIPGSAACGDFGYSWDLTLASETSSTPEPATAGFVLGGLAVFCVKRRLRDKEMRG